MTIGVPHFLFDEIDSTNSRALEYANDRSLDGAVFQARVQTAGRGQYGRVWQAKPGEAILISVLLFPPPELCRPVLLTAFAAVAVCETLAEIGGLKARIKWPNDVLVDGKKICGILIESRVNRDREVAVVCGIGLNLNQTAEDFAERGLPEATSLRMLSVGEDRLADLDTATTTLLSQLNAEYGRLLRGDRVILEEKWVERCGLLHDRVEVECTDSAKSVGTLKMLSFDEIVLSAADGSVRRFKPETIRHLTAAN